MDYVLLPSGLRSWVKNILGWGIFCVLGAVLDSCPARRASEDSSFHCKVPSGVRAGCRRWTLCLVFAWGLPGMGSALFQFYKRTL